MRRAFLFWTVFAVFLFGHHVSRRASLREGYLHVCLLVSKKFYRDDAEVRSWVERCFDRGRRIPAYADREAVFDELSVRIREISVSHFYLNTPARDRLVSYGRSLGTGLHARYVDGRLIVYRVTPRSPAELAGSRAGDEIVAIPGIEEVSPRSASFRRGTYQLSRRGQPFTADIGVAVIDESTAMSVRTLPNGTRVLEVPSFEPRVTTLAEVERVGREIAGAPRVIVDVRENLGGTISGMQRLLALFLREGQSIGAIETRSRHTRSVDVDEALGDWGYSILVEGASRVDLHVPRGFSRYDGPVTVLIESSTGSAAEVFAEDMKLRPNTRVWGWDSAGAVLMGVQYPVPEFGFGYSVMIPHAKMKTANGRDLEQNPVRPERVLFYEIEAALRGEDNWITEASR